jgi:hypothetical protein
MTVKTAQNPDGVTVEFHEDRHVYRVKDGFYAGKELISVTTFISKFFPAFDAPAMAQKCAGKKKYAGMTADEVLAAWETEAERGRSEGTNTHLYAECLLNNDMANLPEPQSEREAALFGSAAMAVLGLEELFEFVASEAIVFSPDKVAGGLAGMTDLIMTDPKNKDWILLDWKQNKEISMSNPWDSGLGPLRHLEASDFNKYGIQLNLYERILRAEGYLPPGISIRKALIHLVPDDGGYRVIKIPNMQKEIDAITRRAR